MTIANKYFWLLLLSTLVTNRTFSFLSFFLFVLLPNHSCLPSLSVPVSFFFFSTCLPLLYYLLLLQTLSNLPPSFSFPLSLRFLFFSVLCLFFLVGFLLLWLSLSLYLFVVSLTPSICVVSLSAFYLCTLEFSLLIFYNVLFLSCLFKGFCTFALVCISLPHSNKIEKKPCAAKPVKVFSRKTKFRKLLVGFSGVGLPLNLNWKTKIWLIEITRSRHHSIKFQFTVYSSSENY